jgi:hypothetical protein
MTSLLLLVCFIRCTQEIPCAAASSRSSLPAVVTSLTVPSAVHASPDDPVLLQISCSTVEYPRTGTTSETRSAHGYGERTLM